MAAVKEAKGTGSMVNSDSSNFSDLSAVFNIEKLCDRVLKIIVEGRPSPAKDSTAEETKTTPETTRTQPQDGQASDSPCQSQASETGRAKRAKIEEEEDSTEKELETEQGTKDQGVRVKRIPVSSAILGGRSPYFLKLFAGDFAEGSIAREVEIHLAPEDESAFSAILQFLYSGKLSDAEVPDVSSVLRHLLLADRFDSKECITALTQRLSTLAEKMDTAMAVALVSCPVTLRRFPKVSTSVEVAREHLVETFGPMMGNPKMPTEFLELPEHALLVLLDSTDLNIDGEDHALLAAYAWLDENVKSRAERLRTLAAKVLPCLRLRYLPPKEASGLCKLLREMLLAHGSPSQESGDPSGIQPFLAPSTILECKAVSNEMASMYAAAAVGHYVGLLVQKCLLPAGSLDAFCDPRSVAVTPRDGYRPPDATMFLDLVLEECNFWTRNSRQRSRARCVAGRWLSIEASYDVRAAQPTLGVYICWEASPKGRDEPFTVRGKISATTGLRSQSKPLGCHKFTERNGRGFADFFDKPWTELLKEHKTYFPEGAMCLKAEVWVLP